MPIYTRTGDTGKTSLFGGRRVLKCEELVEVYGSIDELNSWVGLLLTDKLSPEQKNLLTKIQSDLLTIGSSLAGWQGDLGLLDTGVKEMEATIDVLEKKLPKLTNFILPGGTTLAARFHLARSVCRRTEREAVALSQKPADAKALAGREKVDPRIVKYLNRLSDLFFTLARFINREAKVKEIVWSGINKKVNKNR